MVDGQGEDADVDGAIVRRVCKSEEASTGAGEGGAATASLGDEVRLCSLAYYFSHASMDYIVVVEAIVV